MVMTNAMPLTEEIWRGKRIADQFQTGSLPSTIIRYHTCGDAINGDEVYAHRDYAQRTGYKFLVTVCVAQHPDYRGVHDGSIHLEKYFRSLACARLFMNWYNLRVAGLAAFRFNELSPSGGMWYLGTVHTKNFGRARIISSADGFLSEQLKEGLK